MEKYRSTIGLNLSVFLLMFGVGMIFPLLPQKIIALTGSLTTVGCLASAFAVSFVLLQFPIGRLSDRFGFRKFLLTGYLFCSASGLLYFFSTTQEVIFLGRIIQGIGEAPLWALAPALLATLHPEAKGKVIGFYNASLHMGLTLGSGYGTLVSAYWINNEAFLLFAFSGVLGAFFIFAAVREPAAGTSAVENSIDKEEFQRLYKNIGIIAVFSGIVLYGAGYGIFITVLPGFLIQDKGFTQLQIGWFFTLFYIAVSLSQIITGPISDRHGRRKTMLWGLMTISIGLAMFPGKDGWMVYSCLFSASFGLGVFCVSALAWLNSSVGDSLKGTVSGAFYLLWGIGYFFGPLILGASENAAAGFYLLAALYFIQALLQGMVHYRHGKMFQNEC